MDNIDDACTLPGFRTGVVIVMYYPSPSKEGRFSYFFIKIISNITFFDNRVIILMGGWLFFHKIKAFWDLLPQLL